MKNAVSRFAVNRARQSSRVTRVDGIHVDGVGAAGDVDQSVEFAVGAAHAVEDGRDAVVGGGVGRDGHDREARRGQRGDVLVEVLLGPAHRDHGGAGLRRHAGDGRADAAAARAGDHDDAAVELAGDPVIS